MKNQTFKIIFLLTFLTSIGTVLAEDATINKSNSFTSPKQIISLEVKTDVRKGSYVGIVLFDLSFNNDPTQCEGGSVEYRINLSNQLFDEYYSLLLSASLSENPISVSSFNVGPFVCEINSVKVEPLREQ